MGYYSAVGISIREKDYQKLQDNLRKGVDHNDKPVKQETIKLVQNVLKACDDNYKFVPDDNTKEVYRYLGWDYIKWYENTFLEVDYIMDFIRSLDSGYNFIRLGEEVNDTQEENNGDVYTLCVTRNIDIWGKKIKEDDENNA